MRNASLHVKQQFRTLARKLNRLIRSGEWTSLSASKKEALLGRLQALHRFLSSRMPARALRRALGAAALLIGLSQNAEAQISFGLRQTNPFSFNASNLQYIAPAVADFDGDGDPDMFVGSDVNALRYYQNTGSATVPTFANPVTSPFNLGTLAGDLHSLTKADLDNDGDIDLLAGNNYGNFLYYQNTGSATAPSFANVVQNPFSLAQIGSYAGPVFADIDNDGDFDLFAGDNYARIVFFQNTGSNTAPAFANPVSNPFSITIPGNTYYHEPSFTDIDQDGDLDMFSVDGYGSVYYFENTGTATAPTFAAAVTSPFGIAATNYYGRLEFADMDNDGDDDLFLGDYYSQLFYYENTSCAITRDTITPAPVCEMYTGPSGAQFTMSGTFTDTIPNGAGCDSVITLNLTINTETLDSQMVSSCGPFMAPSGAMYTMTGMYVDTIPNTAGCDSIITFDLTVNPDARDTLSVDACNTYTAPSGAIFTISGQYQDTIPTMAGCDSIFSINLTVAVLDTAVTFNAGTLTAAQSGATYQWVNCDNNLPIPGATSQSYSPGSAGRYAVIVTNGNCTDTSGCRFVNPVGLTPPGTLSDVELYPNPSEGAFTLDLGTSYQEVRISVADMQGRTVYNAMYENSRRIALALENQLAGVYFVTVSTRKGQKVLKLILK